MTDRWLFEAYRLPLRSLACGRILFAIATLIVTTPTFGWITDVPRSLFTPPPGPFMLLLDGYPPAWFFHLLNAVIIVAAWALLLGWRTPWASVALSMAMLVGHGYEYCTGKIDHHILYILAPLVMAPSGWGWALSIDAARRPDVAAVVERDPDRGWCSAMLAMLIGFAMFTAGYVKLTTGWLDPSFSATHAYMMHNRLVEQRAMQLPGWVMTFGGRAMWEIGDWVTVLFEVGFLPAVLWRRTMRLFIAIACLFHVGVVLGFGILFWHNVVTYGLMVDFESAARRGIGRRIVDATGRSIAAASPWLVAVASAAWIGVAWATESNVFDLVVDGFGLHREVWRAAIVGVGAIAGVAYLVRVGLCIARPGAGKAAAACAVGD